MQQWKQRVATFAAVALVAVVAGACAENPTEFEPEVVPQDQWQVIEDVSFDASLAVVLDSMTRTTTGVYWEDLVVGTGPAALIGTRSRSRP